MQPRSTHTLELPSGHVLVLGERTLVMGILNVTPDSFADGGRYRTLDDAICAGCEMVERGADLIDIGGESTRPGAPSVGEGEERARVEPVVRELAKRVSVPLSIDTTKASVAEAALSVGATIVNDISGLQYDPELGCTAARHGAPLVVMHMRGRPSDMYGHAGYDDVVGDVARELGEAVARAERAGVPRRQVVVDPGIGFAKHADHSLRILANVGDARLRALGCPLLVGPSRKSFLKLAIGDGPPAAREWATAAAVTTAVLGGAHIVRVHNVAAMVDVVRVADIMRAHTAACAPRDEHLGLTT